MTRSTKGARVKSTFVEWIEEVRSLHSKRELKTWHATDESLRAGDCRVTECRRVKWKKGDGSQQRLRALPVFKAHGTKPAVDL
jgi:hypothetical protein